MTINLVNINAFDCLPFNNEMATIEVLQEFILSQTDNVFWFSADYNSEDDAKLAEYDYIQHQWVAGRFVGEAIFKYKNVDYKITIKPRFGENMLFRMLEEIFNIRITSSASQHSQSKDWNHYIKRIIAFIWLQKLANANLHGVPKIQVKKEHNGQMIRGRLDVRKSTIPFYRSNEIVSVFREKYIDGTIATIIYEAYRILNKEFDIGKINIPDSAQEAINQIHNQVHDKQYVCERDYKSIRYKDIYLSWKPLVDFSWDIIKRKRLSLKQDKSKNGFGFFIDMAEVWEQYLRAILKKQLLPHGWHYRNDKQVAYKEHFFKRELIPDLVFQKENDIVVWDAKYKRMLGRPFDIDRADFFQIHTYIQNYINHKRVILGGLFFPISTNEINFENYSCPYLINENGIKMIFHIDGIELSEKDEVLDPKIKEAEFLSRIIKSIN